MDYLITDDKESEEKTKEAIAKKVASYKFMCMPDAQIIKELNLTVGSLKTIYLSDHYKNSIKELGDAVLQDARVTITARLRKLVPLMMNTLEFHLEHNNLSAIPHLNKLLGLEKEEEGKMQDNRITVVMPHLEHKPKEEIKVIGLENKNEGKK